MSYIAWAWERKDDRSVARTDRFLPHFTLTDEIEFPSRLLHPQPKMFTFFFFFVVRQHTRSLSSFAILFTLEQPFRLLWRKNAPEMDAISVTSANSLLEPRNNQGSVSQLQFGWTHQECYIINLFPPLPLFPAITTTTSEQNVKWQGLINKASWIDFLFYLFFFYCIFQILARACQTRSHNFFRAPPMWW